MTADFRALLVPVFYIVFLGYCGFWLVVAISSDPTWWWFVPIYGHYKIFGESLWWGLFDVAFVGLVVIGVALTGED